MSESPDPWSDDRLGFREYGDAFTNLITSITDQKVISVEAGFGHGKTFFRKAWAAQLRQAGEVVVEIDAQQSDHSGEPIITFLGALLAAAPEKQRTRLAKLAARGGQMAGVATRAVARVVLRNGAEEVIEAASGWMSAQVEGSKALTESIKEIEGQMSKVAGRMIASQLAAEQARQEELPKQIDALRDALTEGRAARRVVILIDELDRCHPDYAIALLEAMKLVFGRPGFVFCLMVNADYLEGIAHHRFGTQAAGERYLEKFVDLRLQLRATDEAVARATQEMAMGLPLAIPLGEGEAFSVQAAAELAGKLAAGSGQSFRQIKRLIEKVEVALRCYRHRPVDCPLLVFLAFREAVDPQLWLKSRRDELLLRAKLTPEATHKLRENLNSPYGSQAAATAEYSVREVYPELLGLPETVYLMPPAERGGSWHDWYKVLAGLGPRYLPEHEDMLRAVHRILAN